MFPKTRQVRNTNLKSDFIINIVNIIKNKILKRRIQVLDCAVTFGKMHKRNAIIVFFICPLMKKTIINTTTKTQKLKVKEFKK